MVTRGAIRFEHVRFGYGTARGVLHDLSLDIAPGRARRPGRPVRRRQVDAGERAAAVLRARGRPHHDRRAGHRRRHAGEPARADRDGDAGHVAAAPLDPRQHPLRPAAGDARRRSSRPRGRPRRSSSSSQLEDWNGRRGLRRACRRARREALRRPAPAHRDRARDPQERADPGARRGDVRARLRGRGGDPGAARRR